MYAYYQVHEISNLIAKELHYIYALKEHAKQPGFYFMSKRIGKETKGITHIKDNMVALRASASLVPLVFAFVLQVITLAPS